MHSIKSLLLVASLLLFACSPPQKTTSVVLNAAAVSTISTSKKITSLAQAETVVKNKPLTPINATELAEIIKTAAGRLYLFSFWTKDCSTCLEQLRQIENFTTNKGENFPQLVFINLDPEMNNRELNQVLSNQQISAKSFWLENKESNIWKHLLPTTLLESQPYLLMVRNDENIRVGYNQPFSSEALFNLLHPNPLADGFIN